VFDAFKARLQAAQAEKEAKQQAAHAAAALREWQAHRDNLASLLESAKSPGAVPDGLVGHRGELSFGVLTNCSLIEERKGAGHFVSGNAGVSIPIGSLGGHAIRYRVGATRGHYVQGTPEPTAIATGTLYMTNQRICFLSNTQTREVRYDKLVGMTRDDQKGVLTMSVSNRQHPIVIVYGAEVAGWVDFHIDLAMANWRGDIDQMIANLTAQLAELDAQKPGGTTTSS